MDNILDLYNKHKELLEKKEKLNKELQEYVGKNDEESLARVNEIAGELNKVNSDLSEVNSDDFSLIDRYYKSLEEVQKVSSKLKEIEKASKKLGGNEQTKVLSAEGREKFIHNDFLEEYQKLVEAKKKLRQQNIQYYHELKTVSAKMVHSDTKNDTPPLKVEEIKGNESWLDDLINRPLTLEEKLKYEEEKVDTIIKSAKLPNMGKKVRITYDGQKSYIPEKYLGRFKSSVTRINSIRNKLKSEPAVKDSKEEKIATAPPVQEHADVAEVGEDYRNSQESINLAGFPLEELSMPPLYSHEYVPPLFYDFPSSIPIAHEELEFDEPLEKSTIPPKSLIDLLEIVEKNKIEIKPLKVSFFKMPTVSLTKAYTTIKSKVSLKNFKKILPSIWNIDMIAKLGYLKLEGKLLSDGIIIKKAGVSFAEGAIQKYDEAKSFVTTTSKNIVKSAKKKLEDFNKFASDKKDIASKVREGQGVKESMKEVYGEEAENHFDYIIVNGAVNFKADVCQKVSSTIGKIGTFNKNLIDKIKRPFEKLQESMKDDVKRAELEKKIAELKKENKEKIDAMKRVRINNYSSGYVAMSSLIFISTVILSGLVFMLVKTILGR